MKVDIFGDIIGWKFIFAITTSEVDGERALAFGIERGWNINGVLLFVGFFSKRATEERLEKLDPWC